MQTYKIKIETIHEMFISLEVEALSSHLAMEKATQKIEAIYPEENFFKIVQVEQV